MSTQIVTPSTFSQRDEARLTQHDRLIKRLNRNNAIASSLLWLVTMIVAAIFVAIIVYLIWTGIPGMLTPTFFNADVKGIGSQLFNTFYILILTEIFLIPISLAAAIFLVEYTRQGLFVTIIHFAAETLAGVPSLILGMFGFLIFCTDMHMSISRLAGALTLLCLNFPMALRLFEDALTNVPREQREGALALGSTKWHSIWTVVLPSALPGIITSLILTAGKIIGESAALLFTMGYTPVGHAFTASPSIASDTLTTHLYYIKLLAPGSTGLGTKGEAGLEAGTAGLLILLLLIINIAARVVGRQIQRRLTAA